VAGCDEHPRAARGHGHGIFVKSVSAYAREQYDPALDNYNKTLELLSQLEVLVDDRLDEGSDSQTLLEYKDEIKVMRERIERK